jgi:fibronectin type 3 domain-containing protein
MYQETNLPIPTTTERKEIVQVDLEQKQDRKTFESTFRIYKSGDSEDPLAKEIASKQFNTNCIRDARFVA